MDAREGHYTVGVLGASGSVGTEVVSSLLNRPEVNRILLFNRRHLSSYHGEGKVEQFVVPMEVEKLGDACLPHLTGVDAVLITMGVGAPSKVDSSELRLVDVDLPTEFATAASQAGVYHVSLLTSAAADVNKEPCVFTGTKAGSGLYLHLKGLVEEKIKALGFRSVALFRPAAIVGSRNTPAFVNWLAPKVDSFLPNTYQSINVSTLGKAMADFAIMELRERDNGGPGGTRIF
eukprot:TRINITY_DN2080_c0_g1_i1.p1 TRINITY_DN2080_c0_g1~~TRINITY_DN2080_c0_g1_i1.p1  ORF type:complete len:233 (-),score=38.48 TRINITY_DN2080_c0_g1_i1:140-838(-)